MWPLIEQISRRIRGVRSDPGAGTYVVRGITVAVVNTRPDIETSAVVARLNAALGLMEQYEPARLRHMRRDIAQISIIAFPCRGAYMPADRAIVTELSFLHRTAEFTDAQVASSIVHESVHARVHRMRERLQIAARSEMSYVEPPCRRAIAEDRAREERLCRRAELEFGQLLPPALGAPVVRRAVESLALGDLDVAPQVNWSAAHIAKQQADEAAVRLWRTGPPRENGGT